MATDWLFKFFNPSLKPNLLIWYWVQVEIKWNEALFYIFTGVKKFIEPSCWKKCNQDKREDAANGFIIYEDKVKRYCNIEKLGAHGLQTGGEGKQNIEKVLSFLPFWAVWSHTRKKQSQAFQHLVTLGTCEITPSSPLFSVTQIGRFIGLWATF